MSRVANRIQVDGMTNVILSFSDLQRHDGHELSVGPERVKDKLYMNLICKTCGYGIDHCTEREAN